MQMSVCMCISRLFCKYIFFISCYIGAGILSVMINDEVNLFWHVLSCCLMVHQCHSFPLFQCIPLVYIHQLFLRYAFCVVLLLLSLLYLFFGGACHLFMPRKQSNMHNCMCIYICIYMSAYAHHTYTWKTWIAYVPIVLIFAFDRWMHCFHQALRAIMLVLARALMLIRALPKIWLLLTTAWIGMLPKNSNVHN